MRKKTDSLKAKLRYSVFICILIIGIPSMLLLFTIMNGLLFEKVQTMNTEIVRDARSDFDEKIESAISMASWLSQNEEIQKGMLRGETDLETVLKLLENQSRTNTYMIGSIVGPYINKIVVFNEEADNYYVTPNIRNGFLDDVHRIRRSEKFQVFKNNQESNVALYPTLSINKPYEPVLAAFARSMDRSTYIYIEMRATVLKDVFGEHLGKDIFVTDEEGWVYPAEIPEEMQSRRYKESILPISMTPLILKYYTETSPLSIISPYMLIVLSLIVVSAAIMSYIVAHFLTLRLTKPVSRLVDHIGYLRKTNDYGFIDDSIEMGEDEISKIGHAINKMSLSIKDLLDRNEKLFEEKKDTEMQLLQMQVNPHFLYNTLESIHWMAVVQKSEGIAEMSRGLSNLLKNISKNTDDHIPLSEELELLSDYERIQQVRYMGLFEVIDRIPDELKHYHIIKFTLQPLVENAIFHGIEPSGRDGKIILFGHKDEKYLYIDIIDNGIGMTEEEMETIFTRNSRTRGLTGVGLRNVDERLKLTYGPECGIEYHSQKNAYTRVSIKLLLEDGE